MKRAHGTLWRFGVWTFLSMGLMSLMIPWPAQAGGVHVSVGFGIPVPVVVEPAPVMCSRRQCIHSRLQYTCSRHPWWCSRHPWSSRSRMQGRHIILTTGMAGGEGRGTGVSMVMTANPTCYASPPP